MSNEQLLHAIEMMLTTRYMPAVLESLRGQVEEVARDAARRELDRCAYCGSRLASRQAARCSNCGAPQ